MVATIRQVLQHINMYNLEHFQTLERNKKEWQTVESTLLNMQSAVWLQAVCRDIICTIDRAK